MTFFLLKIRVYVGGEAAVLPSTTIVIMCPVKGASKHRVEWLKNDRHIKNGPRLHFSNKYVQLYYFYIRNILKT